MAATLPTTPTLTQAMTRKRSNTLPLLVVIVAVLGAIGFATFGYLESQKTESVVILVRDVPYGHQITAEDLGTLELSLHRPTQLAGLNDPVAVVGQYAARNLGTNDLLQPGMLMAAPPLQPVYPNGKELAVNMVPVPFSVGALGPVTDRDYVNIGFSSSDPTLCDPSRTAAESEAPTAASPEGGLAPTRVYACRYMSYVQVLWLDGGTAYLEMTPYQAQAIWAMQAAGVQLWGERYGLASDPLPAFDRLDFGQVNTEELLAPAPTPLPRTDPLVAPQIPGANAAPIPGSRP